MKSYETLNIDVIAVEDTVLTSNVADSSYSQFQAGFDAFGFLNDERG